MPIELRLMRYVIAVAETASFQRGAERLHMAQPPLSRQIGELERELGVRLFDRRPTRLTEAGRVFVESAREVLAAADRSVTLTKAAANGELGTVHIGYVTSAAYRAFPELSAALRRELPTLRVEAAERRSAELDRALRDNQVDLAMSRSLPRRPEFARLPLSREDLVVVVGARHPLADRDTVHPAELRGSTLLLSRHHSPRYRDSVLAALRGLGEPVDIQDSLVPGWRHVQDLHTGTTFTVVPRSLGEHPPADTVMLPIDGRPPADDLELVWRPDALTPSTARVIAVARVIDRPL